MTSKGSGRALPPPARSRARPRRARSGPAHQHEFGAGCGERQRAGAADPAPGAGDQRGLAVEPKSAIRRCRRHRIPSRRQSPGRPFPASERKSRRAGPEAVGIGGVDLHPAPRELLGAGGVDLLDVVTLQQREFLGVAFDDLLDLAGQGAPGSGIGEQRETRPPMGGQAQIGLHLIEPQ